MRAEALIALAELSSVDDAYALLEEALRKAASRPALQSIIHGRLADASRYRNPAAADEHARVAVELAERLDDDRLRVIGLSALAYRGEIAGDTEAPATLPGPAIWRSPRRRDAAAEARASRFRRAADRGGEGAPGGRLPGVVRA